MAGIQVIEQQGSPIGRLGKGIGKGLADQIPKEIDRYRLSSGLDKFAKESKGKSPFQQAVDFYKIPGSTAEMGYTLFPLLQQEARRDASEKFGKSAGNENKSPRSTGVNAEIISQGDEGNLRPIPGKTPQGRQASKQDIKALKSSETTQRQLQPIIQKTSEQLYGEAAQMSRDNPQLFKSPEDALPIVQGNENARLSNLQEQRNVGNTADTIKQRVLGGIEQAWNKDDTLKDIPGTLQSRIFENAEEELAKGKKTESQIVKESREQGKDLAFASKNLDAAGRQRWYTTPKGIREVLPDIRKTFAKSNALEEYQDLVSSKLGVSPQIAAEFAYPLNKEQKNFFRDHVEEPKRETLGSLFTEAYSAEDVKKKSVALADDMADFLGEDDSILAFAAEAQRRHLKPQIILNRLKRNAEDGLWTPNARQSRELQKVIPDLPSLGDFYMSFQLDDEDMVD